MGIEERFFDDALRKSEGAGHSAQNYGVRDQRVGKDVADQGAAGSAPTGGVLADMKLGMDSKQRFSNRVEDYVRYRPGYPREILDVLRAECGLTPESVVVDVGSGTGLLTQIFLENGNVAYGVEPNAAMREAGEQFLEKYRHFSSVAGTAEATTLPDASADFVVAGQAFHWFDAELVRAEFQRVLKPEGWVAIVWNERKKDATELQRDYERLLQNHSADYKQVASKYPDVAGWRSSSGRKPSGTKRLRTNSVLTGQDCADGCSVRRILRRRIIRSINRCWRSSRGFLTGTRKMAVCASNTIRTSITGGCRSNKLAATGNTCCDGSGKGSALRVLFLSEPKLRPLKRDEESDIRGTILNHKAPQEKTACRGYPGEL